MLRVDYFLRNGSDEPLAVFDRGSTHELSNKQLEAGANAPPSRKEKGDGLERSDRARALPRPSPTVPRISLAARVDRGEVIDGRVDAEVAQYAKVRYCLGVAPFDTGTFTVFATSSSLPLWRTPFKVAAIQQILCAPWKVLATTSFAST